MKKVFIYYSLSGNGDAVASFLKKNGYEIIKVITKEPLSKNKVLSILTGGFFKSEWSFANVRIKDTDSICYFGKDK